VNSLRYSLVFPYGEGQGQPVIALGITGVGVAQPNILRHFKNFHLFLE